MKLLVAALVVALGSTATAVHHGVLPCPCELWSSHFGDDGGDARGARPPIDPRAEYVEARDCSVFAGACHVNSEADSQGRSAVAAWRFATGLTVVAAIEADANLGLGGARRAVLFVDGARAKTTDVDAVVAEVSASAGLRVIARHATPITWQRSGDEFVVAIEDVLELRGAALADRSCCKMPNTVWYRPLATEGGAEVADAVVGHPSRCRFAGSDGLAPWTYEDANTAFVGRYVGAATALSTAP